MKTFIAILCLVPAMAFGQANLMNMLTPTTITASTTNTVRAGLVGWNVDARAVIQQTIVTTNDAVGLTNTVTKTFDTSDNGVDWVLNQYTVTTLLNKTTNATAIASITNTLGGKWLRLGEDRNTNTNAVTTVRFTMSIKDE